MEKILTDRMRINIGPQHPSTHGVMRMIVDLDGETVENVETVIGYLHRGMEKMAETSTYIQYLPIVDRIDYLSGFFCSYAYVNGIELLMDIEISEKSKYIRTITMELNRMASHLLWLGCFMMDLGASSPFFYTFIEREKILDIFENLTGNRMMYNYYTFGGVKRDIDKENLYAIKKFSDEFVFALKDLEELINYNPIFISRTKNLGILEKECAYAYSITGVNLRASGIKKDLRKDKPYLIYENIEFNVPISENKDVQARYILRIKELKESNKIVQQCIDWLLTNLNNKNIITDVKPLTLKPEGIAISEVESSRGLMQCIIYADGTLNPYRIKWRTPSFYNVQIINEISKGYLLSDLIAIFGSLDIIMPEVDR